MSLKAKVAGLVLAAGFAVAGLAPMAQADPVGDAVDNAVNAQITKRVDNVVRAAEQAFPGLDLDLRP